MVEVISILASNPDDPRLSPTEGLCKNIWKWAVVVTQLVEQWLLTPEIRDSNPVIGKFYFPSTVLKDEKKRGREWPKVLKYLKIEEPGLSHGWKTLSKRVITAQVEGDTGLYQPKQ